MSGVLDHVALGSRGGACEALDRERPDVDEGLSTKDEVADDLADRRALQEPVAREARGVEEPADTCAASPTSALWSGVTS